MDLKTFKAYCLKKKGAEETYPFDDKALVMKAGGKMFALTCIKPFKMKGEEVPAFHHISLKCDPDMGADLRRNFSAIFPGWHLNKTHWISLLMDGSLKDQLVKDLIDHAYELVVASLPAKKREELGL